MRSNPLYNFLVKKNMKNISIAGSGIAGLSAAFNLSKMGYSPIIYEKENCVGNSRDGDFEGIENWVFENNYLDFFKKIGFNESKITTYSIKSFDVHSDLHDPISIKSQKPFFYLVKRGSKSNCLDYQLYNQCVEMGVEFVFNKKIIADDADIIATGSKKAAAFIRGINFSTNAKDQVHLLLGKKFAPKGYAYLIILNGEGTLATAFKKNGSKSKDPFSASLDYFKKIGIEMNRINPFGGRGSFFFPKTTFSYPYIIGEAGGFQDYLFGFGMRFSFLSGLAAAKAISGDKNCAKKTIKELKKKMRLSFINRMLYERLNDRQMLFIAKKIALSKDPIEYLSNAYKWNIKTLFNWIKLNKKNEIYFT